MHQSDRVSTTPFLTLLMDSQNPDCNGHEAGYVSAGLGVSHLRARPVEPSALHHYVKIWQKGRTLSNALNVSLEAIVAAFAPTMSAAT